MNLYVADPEWGWWIVLYFYLGGIAAGTYFLATLIDLTGSAADRAAATLGYRVAFPLILLCGVFLIVDLNRPERFWHMLARAEVVHDARGQGWPWTGAGWARLVDAPLIKPRSPMSVGSWALGVFGLCSGLSFLGTLRPEGRWACRLGQSRFALGLKILGCLVGFFVASYTGSLLMATNQPVWSGNALIAPLFLTSAASTGCATLLVLAVARRLPDSTRHRLERVDRFALGSELLLFTIFLASLGDALPRILATGPGRLLIFGTLLVGLVLPLALHRRGRAPGARAAVLAALLALLGGFLLRYGLLTTPPALLAQAQRV